MTSQRPDLAAVVERLEKVEAQNRRMKFVGVMALVLAAGGLLMGQALPQKRVVEAEEFVVKDGSGKIRGGLGRRVGIGGEVGLDLIDSNGIARATLALAADGSPWLFFSDQYARTRVILDTGWGKEPSLDLSDDQGNRISLSTYRGVPSVSVSKKMNGISLRLLPEGRPTVLLIDQTANPRAALGLMPDGRPSLNLWDEKGKLRAVFGHTSLQQTKTGELTERAESSLVLFDKNGKVLWITP